ncbi:LysR family transcriptional regulator [Mycolicibacterium phocaicum]|uniref:LysR family transcriptional regulator n=1 Tax=Mycolicibacterium phocaicum TaxID=319706 RepID=UPI00092B9603|nr:LysR family transcriptional regulator [Mycolicibacterium phocaicum]UCZ61651.1 LysR family transcriptional regulator [Mycolicibacterium phocaicum]SHU25918.1 putative regulatory protein (LysR family) [Mycobacteroides abscessus subsp. abscessus]
MKYQRADLLDTRKLRLLHELSLRGTLSEVAEALHQSPSSISQALSQLEREVGVPLLEKVGRRLRLTPAAEVLVEHTSVILARLEQAASDVAVQSDEASGTVRLAVFQSAASAFMPQMLTELATRHPRLRVTMSQREPEQALYETWLREFDLVIAEEYPGHAARAYPDLHREPLTTDLLRLAVPPSGDPWDRISSVEDAADLPWTMEPEGTASRHWAEQLCRRAGFEPDVRFETDDLEAQIALIENGNAVAILPDLMRVRRRPNVRVVDVDPRRRVVFTATRTAISKTPAIVACRAALASAVPPQLDVD